MTSELKHQIFDVDVGQVLEGQRVAVEIIVRKDLETAPCAILICLTGGGVTRRFFDLRIGNDVSFSFAQAMADRGFAVVMIDHLGVGDSSRPEDCFDLVPEVLADANAEAARAAIAFIRNGLLGTGNCSPPVYGVGHSMGGMVTVLIQARHALYEGLVLLGYVANGAEHSLRPSALSKANDPQQIRHALKELTQEMFGGAMKHVEPRVDASTPRTKPRNLTDENASRLFRPEAADPAGTLALKATLAPVINVSVLFAIIPGSHLPEMKMVKTPILVIVGEYDFAYPPRDLEKLFPNSPSIATFLPSGIGHNVFNFPGRENVFVRVGQWLDEVTRQSRGPVSEV